MALLPMAQPRTPGTTFRLSTSSLAHVSDSSTRRPTRGCTVTMSGRQSATLTSRTKSLATASRGSLLPWLRDSLADGSRFAGDANDDFIVEVQRKIRGRKWDRQAKHRLRTLRSEFRLRHALSGCYLFSHKVKLPEWGFEQQEVAFAPQPLDEEADGR